MIPDGVFTLDKAKAHLRVLHAEEDALITAMLDAAVAACERATRLAWTKREWSVTVDACDLDSCGCDSPAVFHALLSPATAKVFAVNGATDTELPAGDVYLSTRYGHTVVNVRAWNVAHAAEGNVGRIDYTAEPVEVPADVYAAAMLFLGDLYENREAQVVGISVSPNPAAEMLLRSYVVDMHA